MIHYHGAPASGPVDAAGRFYAGRHIFVSFAAPSHIEIVAEAAQSFALDNGAYSAWKSKRTFDVAGFRAWVRDWQQHPGCDWHVIPDVIDGREPDNLRIVDNWPFDRAVSVPVWHLHESLAYLRHLARYFPRVAFGSSGEWASPGTVKWWERMNLAMQAVTDEHGRPTTKLHGLRMLSPRVFQRLPLASADSTNAVRNSAYDKNWTVYAPREPWQRAGVIADRVESYNSAPVWGGA